MAALIPVAVLAVALAAWYALWLREKRRRLALLAFCASKGWQFRLDDPSLAGRWQRAPFGIGESRRSRDVMTGTDRGRPFVAFDYSYVTESSDGNGHRSRTTHRFAVVAVALPGWLPDVQVVPENLLHRMAHVVGLGSDIELESEDFNRRFRVTAHDPKFASDVLAPRTMQALLQGPAVAWRIEGSDVLAWTPGETSSVDVLSRLDLLHRVVDGIPSFVWHDNGIGTGPADPSEGSS
jgi:hypothetical protein